MWLSEALVDAVRRAGPPSQGHTHSLRSQEAGISYGPESGSRQVRQPEEDSLSWEQLVLVTR